LVLRLWLQGMLDALQKITAAEGGLRGLWRGSLPAVQRAAELGLQGLQDFGLPPQFGAFMLGAELFDAQLFDVPPLEAAAMDPQQRLVLQVRRSKDGGGMLCGFFKLCFCEHLGS
jgi:hypothetical protein